MVKKQNLLKKQSPDNHTTDKVNVISNCLLGQYVGDEYVIADSIKEELIAVKKVKKSVFQNSVFCVARFEEYGELQFEVTFSKNTVKNVAMCELFSLEKESKINGYIENTIRTKVGQYVDELENFIEKAYAYFNISLTEQNGKEYNLEEDISIEAYIGAKRKFNNNMAKLTKKQYNKLYKDYVTKRLELLKQINSPYTQSILEKFNQEYAKIEKYFLEDNNYKSISELLDKCIEDCSGINPAFAQQEKELMDQMKPLVDDFSKQAETIAKEAEASAKDKLPVEDKNRTEDLERQLQEMKNRASQQQPTTTRSPGPTVDSSAITTRKPGQQPTRESRTTDAVDVREINIEDTTGSVRVGRSRSRGVGENNINKATDQQTPTELKEGMHEDRHNDEDKTNSRSGLGAFINQPGNGDDMYKQDITIYKENITPEAESAIIEFKNEWNSRQTMIPGQVSATPISPKTPTTPINYNDGRGL